MNLNKPNAGIDITANPIEDGDFEKREKPDQLQEDLDPYIREMDNLPQDQLQKSQALFAELASVDPADAEKYKKNISQIRTAGQSQEENKNNPLKKHVLLSKEYLQTQQVEDNGQAKISFTVDFKNNTMAENHVGMGDLLPTNVEAVKVIDDNGYTITNKAVRRINKNNRIGYYDYDSGAYIPIYTGFKVIILQTKKDTKESEKKDNTLELQKLKEEIALYQPQQDTKREVDQDDLQQSPAKTAWSQNRARRSKSAGPSSMRDETPESPPPGPISGSTFQTSRPELLGMGFMAVKGRVPPEVTAKAREILAKGHPIGTTTVIELPSGTWAFRDEIHQHPKTANVSENLKKPHHGVTAYQMA
jgi:hypothetical protein